LVEGIARSALFETARSLRILELAKNLGTADVAQ
jgi:hypothetical protein